MQCRPCVFWQAPNPERGLIWSPRLCLIVNNAWNLAIFATGTPQQRSPIHANTTQTFFFCKRRKLGPIQGFNRLQRAIWGISPLRFVCVGLVLGQKLEVRMNGPEEHFTVRIGVSSAVHARWTMTMAQIGGARSGGNKSRGRKRRGERVCVRACAREGAEGTAAKGIKTTIRTEQRKRALS